MDSMTLYNLNDRRQACCPHIGEEVKTGMDGPSGLRVLEGVFHQAQGRWTRTTLPAGLGCRARCPANKTVSPSLTGKDGALK